MGIHKGGDNWSNTISIILNGIHCMHVYRNKTWCDIKEIENRLIDNYVTKWKTTIEKTPKLRTYIMFKDILEPETYIIKCMSRRRRSLMSQFSFFYIEMIYYKNNNNKSTNRKKHQKKHTNVRKKRTEIRGAYIYKERKRR